MADKLTPQQQLAVDNRGGNLLVSAAAGSGKTKVLVDRLISYLTDPVNPANIDEFLIITYTKAAAAELRTKIAAKLTERMSEDPSNRHLHRQLQRLYLTNISTIHSFCSDIIREYAYMLDVAADFRVADENECQEMQLQILDRILEDAYTNADPGASFYTFIDTQGFGRNDHQIPEIILKVYNSARCHPDPEGWLNWCLNSLQGSEQTKPEDTLWGHYLIEDFHHYLDLQIAALTSCCQKASLIEFMEKPVALLNSAIVQLQELRDCCTWDEIRDHPKIEYGRLLFSKKCTDLQLNEEIKAVRNACKDGVAKKLTVFSDSSNQTVEDLKISAEAAEGLINLVRTFSGNYDSAKKSRRVLDFGDLEHKMLDLLLGKRRSGITNIAKQLGERFREVMIDEYQDSNEVQDKIFAAITGMKQNCFMVGDVKQSIYQFRLADPDIFLNKYHTYHWAENAAVGEGRKVVLSSNFRSSGGVIGAVNDVFRNCMSAKVGGVEYLPSEYLKEGIPHIPLNEPEVELYGILVQQDTYVEEAAFTAERIVQLLDGHHMVRDKDGLRPILPEDIVILLRSPGSTAYDFKLALESRGINCSSGSGIDLMQTEEVSVLRSLMQVISNPLQDIPLACVLASRVFSFSADELAEIRSASKHTTLFDALCVSSQPKVKNFIDLLSALRRDAKLFGLSHLIHQIFVRTRIDSIYASMQDGEIRKENLQAFCSLAENYESTAARGLDAFLAHLTALEDKGVLTHGEQSNTGCVTIMSIHKSKGLEFPVVFLCGLSRSFNRESANAPVLCHKDLGLGLSCIDESNRVRYPSIARRALSRRILQDSISEEMRVLYVAMTRPKDRLIMTYASKTLDSDLSDIILRSAHTNLDLMTSEVICPGEWILQAALKRTEAGEFFALAGSIPTANVSDTPWKISVINEVSAQNEIAVRDDGFKEHSTNVAGELSRGLEFSYGYMESIVAPSKLTATQLKGRIKDIEIAENTGRNMVPHMSFRKPSFVGKASSGMDYGNAFHKFVQYADFDKCTNVAAIQDEMARMSALGLLSQTQVESLQPENLVQLFTSPIGIRIRSCAKVLREFKFSILDSSEKYAPGTSGDFVLLQGIVDCALIEQDGITIIDFKTDQVNEQNVITRAAEYRNQVCVYADALSRIYELPIKEAFLYFSRLNRFVPVNL